jgi:HNH endonuclease
MTATCTEPDCGKPVRARGLCNTHYQWHRRHGTLPARMRGTTDTACAAPDCGDPVTRKGARGLCPKHYQRLTKGKSPGIEQPMATAPDEDRFWSKVDRQGPDSCWPWTGGIQPRTGYGHIWWQGTTRLAHRVAYELTIGPIPAGLELDHVYKRGCRYRHCVNPAHLEPVPPAVNKQRQRPAVKEKLSAAGRKGAAARWGKDDT